MGDHSHPLVIPTKRSAPISASAFSFTLPTTSTPAKRSRPLGEASGFGTPFPKPPISTLSTPGPSRLPDPFGWSSTTGARAPAGNAETPTKSGLRSLNALPSPLFQTLKSYAAPEIQGKRLGELIDESSPFRTRDKGKEKDVDPSYVGLRHLPGPKVENIRLEEVRRDSQDDEGIGVSPRRKSKRSARGAKLTPATRLEVLVSSHQSSLALFYTSMQNTLYPRATPKRAAREGSGEVETEAKTISAQRHLRTSPLVLRAKESVVKSGWGNMMLCEVVRWERGGGAQKVSREVRDREDGRAPKEGPSDGDEQGVRHGGDDEREDRIGADDDRIDEYHCSRVPDSFNMPYSPSPPPHTGIAIKEVLLLLHPLPQQCPRLGLDARLVLSKLGKTDNTLDHEGGKDQEGRKGYEVGIWGPWGEVEIPLSREEMGGRVLGGVRDDGERGKGEGEGVEGAGRGVKVVVASRYLIAEGGEGEQ